MINDKGYKDQGLGSSKKSVGLQGSGGPKGSSSVDHVSNPKGIAPKKLGSKAGMMSQGPIEPKVGK